MISANPRKELLQKNIGLEWHLWTAHAYSYQHSTAFRLELTRR